MMAICSAAIAGEQSKAAPDSLHLDRLERELDDLARERRTLAVNDSERIATIRETCGARIRAHRQASDGTSA